MIRRTVLRRRLLSAVAVLVVLGTVACGSTEPAGCRTDLSADSLGVATGSGLDTLGDADLDRYFGAAADSGAAWVRFDFDWSILEPRRGEFDWSGTDRVVDAARAHGLQILGLLTHTPEWARAGDADDTHGRPADPDEFGRFGADVAQRYRDRISHWEIWNEPNLAVFFGPQPDPVAYAALLESASSRIRAAVPGAVIVSGGLSPATDNGTDIAPTTFLSELYELGVAESFDVVGMHPYSYPALPSDASTKSWNSFYRMRDMHDIMIGHGDDGKPMWATEFGSPTGTGTDAVDAERQAEILRDGITEQRRLGFVDKLFVYSLVDRGTDESDREQNFGVIDHALAPKPAWHVMRTAATTSGCI